MKTIQTIIMNAFDESGNGGNPAALVLDADHYSTSEKQEIASSIGLSETVFISSSKVADYKLDFFTPTKQIAHCGHATIATFSFLKQSGKITKELLTKETIDGLREIRFIGDKAFMEQKSPVFASPGEADLSAILSSVSLRYSDLKAGAPPVIVNTGNAFLLLETGSEAALANATPDLDAIRKISEAYGLIGFYLFYRNTDGPVHATTRMFAPLYGIAEEAATGMAAGPLGCLLFEASDRRQTAFLIEQGRFMAAPAGSRIEVILNLKNGKISGLFAGGTAYQSGTKSIHLKR